MRIRTTRLARKLTQKALAERLGVSVSTYQRYERGAGLSAHMLATLALEMKVSMDYLMGISDDPELRRL